MLVCANGCGGALSVVGGGGGDGVRRWAAASGVKER